jgi:hypothetical protein
MPTIEIISIDSALNIDQNDFEVSIRVYSKLQSHRGLFYDFLIKQSGTMIHVGNPDFKNDEEFGFFGGAIIDWGLESSDLIIPKIDINDPTYGNWGANQSFKYRFAVSFPEVRPFES